MEAGLRRVELARAGDGTLGISIKGGREYNLPILVSRVTSDQEKARCTCSRNYLIIRHYDAE